MDWISSMVARNSILIQCLVFALLLTSCSDSNTERESSSEYSFFVAGHAYGNPNKPQYGIYPPLLRGLDSLSAGHSLDFGVLTGDVVLQPTSAYWDSALMDIERLNIPIHIAAGNHDKGPEFVKRFGEYFYSFEHKNDLFIVLAPEKWNIVGEQLEFLRSAIEEVDDSTRNIFIFCHELIFWHPDNEFGEININWKPHFPGQTNFEEDVRPILEASERPIFFITGDIGATWKTTDYFSVKQGHMNFIGSGVGSGKGDNLILIEIDDTGNVSSEFLSLDSSRFLDPLPKKGLKEIN